ncbi:MAG: hypothetical protein COB90_05205 [Hyphomicrobiales bacterium]|nr:MAG: hypothetical protein COB90_05205 [Hyphomicrobiales bacterium]
MNIVTGKIIDQQLPVWNPDLGTKLATEMHSVSQTGRYTKRSAVRIAIMNVIRDNTVKPGEMLPSEKELTIILGVSLGTVQAALRGLQDIGAIVRRRGDGTRVASGSSFGESVWHFRFVSKEDGSLLRLSDQRTWIDVITEHGIWSEHLGECDSYVRIRRVVQLQNDVHAGAEMFLNASSAKGLTDISPSDLVHANIRPYLEERFGLATKSATHLVKTIILDEAAAEIFEFVAGEQFYEIHASTWSQNRKPVYFQRIYIATDACALVF